MHLTTDKEANLFYYSQPNTKLRNNRTQEKNILQEFFPIFALS